MQKKYNEDYVAWEKNEDIECALFSNYKLGRTIQSVYNSSQNRLTNTFINGDFKKENKQKGFRDDLIKNISSLLCLTSFNEEEKLRFINLFWQQLHLYLGQAHFSIFQNIVVAEVSKALNIRSLNAFPFLFYAFRRWHADKKGHAINKEVMKDLFGQTIVHCQTYQQLLGRSKLANERIRSEINGIHLERKGELENLSMRLKKGSLLLIEAPKGMGKSVLIKSYLEQQPEGSWLFIDTINEFNNIDLLQQISDTLSSEILIRLLVFDAAEYLVEDTKSVWLNKIAYWLKLHKDLTIIFTITDTGKKILADRGSFEGINIVNYVVPPLTENMIETLCPHLKHCDILGKLNKLAQSPFYLSLLSTYFQNVESLDNTVITDQAELVNKIVAGFNSAETEKRLILWQKLSYHLLINKRSWALVDDLYANVSIIQQLCEAGILQRSVKQISFTHELFLDYGLINWLNQNKNICLINGSINKWLYTLPELFCENHPKTILTNWLFFNIDSLEGAFCCDWKLVCDYGRILPAIAMKKQNNSLLEKLLKAIQNMALSSVILGKRISILGIYNKSLISIAIRQGNAEALTLLFQYCEYPPQLEFRPENQSKLEKESNVSDSEDSTSTKESYSDCEDSIDYSDEVDYDSCYNSSDNSDTNPEPYYSDTDPVYDALMDWLDSFTSNPHKYQFSTPFIEEPPDVESDYDDDYDIDPVYEPTPEVVPDHTSNYLLLAASLKQTECFKILWKNVKDVETVNEQGENALLVTVKYRAHEILAFILEENQIETNSVDQWGESALHNAVYNNDDKAVEMLLEDFINPNLANSFGITALHIALVNLNWPTTKLLLDYGADLSYRAFDRYIEDTNQDVEEYFVCAGLLEKVSEHKKEECKGFILKLIAYLNYGYTETIEDCDWGKDYDDQQFIEANKQKQMEQVSDIFEIIADEAQINEFGFGFDYYDEETLFEPE